MEKGKTMSRYIDADALDYRNDKLHDVSADFIKGIEYMHERITDAPTIDAVSVVRCKECVFRNKKYICQTIETDDDDYCSYGERKESE